MLITEIHGNKDNEKISQIYLDKKLHYLSNKKGFLGIDNKSKIKENVVIVPFGLEKTVSYGGGTKNGPSAIIKASHQVELYDEDLNKEPYKFIGIKTLKNFKIKNKIHEALKQIEKINENLIKKNKLPVILGGEHSLTAGAIRPFVKKFKKIYLLHFDAHADLRNSYNGNKFSHASAIRRCLDFKNVNVVSFGIRNISSSEIPFYKKNKKRIKIFWAKDKLNWKMNHLKKILKNQKVYITFDVDGFDSSVMPATGTPEPGGLFWDETIKIIKTAAQTAKIIGVDVNELSPIKGFDSYNFLVAKLVYKILSYTFEFKNK